MTRARYSGELAAVRENLIAMGDTTISLLGESLRSISEPNPEFAATAAEMEALTDQQHRAIHDQCLSLITLQAPVARDARLVTAVLDAIVDLELIGDYAYEIVGLASPKQGRTPAQMRNQVVEAGGKVKEVLAAAVDSWRSDERELALSVRPREAAIRAECQALGEKVSMLTSAPGDVTAYVNLLLICRHLERILRHAVCVASQAAEAACAAPASVAPVTAG